MKTGQNVWYRPFWLEPVQVVEGLWEVYLQGDSATFITLKHFQKFGGWDRIFGPPMPRHGKSHSQSPKYMEFFILYGSYKISQIALWVRFQWALDDFSMYSQTSFIRTPPINSDIRHLDKRNKSARGTNLHSLDRPLKHCSLTRIFGIRTRTIGNKSAIRILPT